MSGRLQQLVEASARIIISLQVARAIPATYALWSFNRVQSWIPTLGKAPCIDGFLKSVLGLWALAIYPCSYLSCQPLSMIPGSRLRDTFVLACLLCLSLLVCHILLLFQPVVHSFIFPLAHFFFFPFPLLLRFHSWHEFTNKLSHLWGRDWNKSTYFPISGTSLNFARYISWFVHHTPYLPTYQNWEPLSLLVNNLIRLPTAT